jgi:hypothetical protein
VLTKGGGPFKIDHPLDPANKTLSHSYVESPDFNTLPQPIDHVWLTKRFGYPQAPTACWSLVRADSSQSS